MSGAHLSAMLTTSTRRFSGAVGLSVVLQPRLAVAGGHQMVRRQTELVREIALDRIRPAI